MDNDQPSALMLRVKTFNSQAVRPLIQDFFKRATEAAEQGHRMVPLNAPTQEIEKLMLIRLTELGYKRDCMHDEKKHCCVTCASWV